MQKNLYLIFLSFLFILNANAQAPAAPSVTGNRYVCSGTATTLSATGTAGASFAWYDAASGGNLLSSAASYTTATLSSSTHFYVQQSLAGNTSTRTDVYVLVTPLPSITTPQSVIATPSTICQGNSSNLTATVDAASGQVVKWYDAPTGGNLIATRASGAAYNVAPTATTTYYAQSQINTNIVNFNYTGGMQTFTVPAGVTSLQIDAYGGRGGFSGEYYHNGQAGYGGRVQTTMTVYPGEVLNLFVGGQGFGDPQCYPCSSGGPGWNGGGYSPGSGNGGGATDIRLGGTSLTDRILVAGGGGGGAGNSSSGGAGGGLVAANGGLEPNSADWNGKGATQINGGAGACFNGGSCGAAGSLGNGGNAGDAGGNSGGAGGGGYYGGGGGTLTGGGGGGSSYSNASYFTNVVHTPGYNGGYGGMIISYNTGSECATTTRVPVTLTVNTTPNVSAGANVITCNGTPVTLQATGADTYIWTPGNLTGANPVVNPSANTTYTVVGKLNNGGCTNTSSMTVTVTSVSASANQSICLNNGTTLSASGADTYTWTPGNLTGQSVGVAPTTTTTYTVTGHNNTGCSSTATTTVTVNPLPPTNAGVDQTINAGSNVTLTASGADTYNWYPISASTGTVTFSPSATNTYTVTGYYNGTGCQKSDQVIVTVIPATVVTGNTIICKGGSTSLTATGTAPFRWYADAGATSLLFTGATFNTPALNSNTGYWVSGNGGAVIPVSISVTDPALSFTPTAVPATICAGTSSALGYTGAAVNKVNWYDAATGGNLVGSTLSGATLPVTPNVNTTYFAESQINSANIVFNYTGSMQTFTVPAGVTSIQVDGYGGRGGFSGEYYHNGQAGYGGRVQATMSVTPGQVLNIFVGGQGYGDPQCYPCTSGGPGWNGGGYSPGSGNGGGATDIRIGGTAITNRVYVAGGGGGGSGNSASGGAGGGLNSANGGLEPSSGDWNGKGASQTNGGSGACFNGGSCGATGSFGNGGNAGDAGGNSGGAGGGGYFGGGGGTLTGGGGGGSSYTNPGYFQNVIHTPGYAGGYGGLTISYNTTCINATRVPVVVTVNPKPVVTIAGNAAVCAGNPVTLTASGASTYSWINPPVDQVPSAKLAAGLRRLNSSYAGNAIQIRRASDNTTKDIGFISNELDTASINAFVGTGSAFCTIIYDQSGNGNNITQTNVALQPVILNTGLNGKPSIRFTSSQWMSNPTNFSSPFSAIYTARQNGPGRGRMLSGLTNNWLMGWWNGNKAQAYFEGWVSATGGSASDNNIYVYSGTSTGSSSSFYQNALLLNTNGGGTQGPNGLELNGYSSGGELSDGDFTEVYMYNSVLSTTNRSFIEHNSGAYYGVLSGSVTGSTFTATPTLNTSYYVVGTDANGCTSNAIKTVTVNAYPVIQLPANITVNNDPGLCSAVVNFTATATGTPAPVVTYSQNPGTVFNKGTTTVTVTANTGTCQTTGTFTVTVVDNEAPVVSSGVADLKGACSVTATAPKGQDNCDGTITATTTDPLTYNNQGTYVIHWTYTDSKGNKSTQNQNVIVQDITPPVISGAPSNMTVSNDPGICGAKVTWTLPVASDNCTLVSFTSTHVPGETYPIGTTIVTYTAKDEAGLTTTASFNITVNDTEDPVIHNIPAAITKNNDPGQCGAVVSWTNATVTDNCPGATLISSYHSGDMFLIGTTQVVYLAKDAHGNTIQSSFTVTVTDTENPVIHNTPASINQSTDPGQCGAAVSWTSATVSDNCSGAVLSSDHNSGDVFPIGTTTVTYTATDAYGNTVQTSFNVTVSDNEKPVISNVPANINLNNDAGKCGAFVNWVMPVATDNCGNPSLLQTGGIPSGKTYPVGTTVNTFKATDTYGNTTTASFSVTITDNELPVISAPSDISVNNDAGQCSANLTIGSATTGDNCGVASVVNDHASTTYPVGTTIVKWTVTDIHGNVSSANQQIIVKDNTPPSITGLSDIVVSNDQGVCGAKVFWSAPSITDNCGIASSSSNHHSGDPFTLGTTVVTYTATDIHGNVTSVSFNVTVKDTEKPVITNMPPNQVLNTDNLSCNTLASWAKPTVTDNCGVASLLTNYAFYNNYGFALLPKGVNVITFTATDVNGNQSSASFTITVVDNQDPLLTGCPQNITKNVAPGTCGQDVYWSQPSASDNCPGVMLTADHMGGENFPVGTTVVNYLATDASGRTARCSFTITIVDNEKPKITAPGNITVNNDAGICGATVNLGTPVTSDNCGVKSVTNNAPALFPVGTTIVTWTVTDINNNTKTATQSVVVNDTEQPSIVSAGDQTETADAGKCSAAVVVIAPAVNDNCQVASLTNNINNTANASGVYPVGTTKITWTVTDSHGNSKSATQNITVTDNENPSITSPANIAVNNDAGKCGAVVNLTTPATADNCGVASVTNNAPAFFPVGSTVVTWTVTDVHGNVSSVTQSVTVTDNENPTVTAPANISVNNDAGQCSATVNIGTALTSDNCGVATVTNDHASSVYPVGTTTVTWTVTDIHGNSSSATQNITVTDNEKPVVSAIDISGANDPGKCGKTVTVPAPSTSDNCGVASTAGVRNDGLALSADYPVGVTTITWTVTDIHGNVGSSTQKISISDNENPTITAPANVSVNNDAGKCGAVVNLTTPATADNCGVVSVTNNAPAFFPVGSTVVTWTVTDVHGNVSSATQSVTVTDNENPTVTAPANIAVNNDAGQCSAIVNIGSAQSGDNCGVANLTNDHASSVYPVGTTTVTWTVTDIHGNTSSATQNITVTDNEKPVVSAIDISGANDPGKCGKTVTVPAPSTSDNCGVASTAGVRNDGLALSADYPVGVTTITWTVTDIHGNVGSSTQKVIITDQENPTIATTDISQNNDAGKCGATVVIAAPVTSDNCNVASTSGVRSDALSLTNLYPVGVTTILWTVTDNSGNTATTTQTISITDNEKPSISTTDVTVTSDPGKCSAAVTLAVPVTNDNCGVSSIVGVRSDGQALNSPYPVGSTTITWTVQDVHGNSNSTVQTVVVNDNEAPSITAPADITAFNDGGNCSAVVNTGSPVTGDNCAVLSIVNNHPSSTYPVGKTVVTWTVTDIHGNVSVANQLIQVLDNEKPSITTPASITVNNDAGKCSAVVNLTTPATADNCDVATVTNDHASSVYPVGTTTVTWTVTDIHGNSSSATQNITVTDNEKPTVTAAANISVNNDAGQCNATVNIGTALTADNCGVATVTNDHASSVYPVGTTTVTWTVTDIHGNSSSATQTITVTDNEKPVVTAPANIAVNNDAGQCSAVLNIGTATSSDNCSVSTVVNDHPSTTYPVGTTTVTWTATDIHGNSSTATQKIIVTDNEKPVISISSVSVNNDNGICGALVTLGTPVTSDNCGVASVTNNHSSSMFNVGNTVVTWTVTDVHGNTSSVLQNVTVTDIEKPVAKTKNITIQLDATGKATITPAQVNNGSTDNCGVATLLLSKTTFDCSNVGTNTVTLTVTDVNGNSSSATATVTVQDLIAPTVLTKNISVTLVNGTASITAAQINNGSYDNCSILNMSVAPSTFVCGQYGNNTVTLTVTDVNGNTSTKTAIVNVIGVSPNLSIALSRTDQTYTGTPAHYLALGYGAQNLTMTASNSTSAPAQTTYQWTPGVDLSSTVVANPLFTATTAGNFIYKVTAKNEYGCTSSMLDTIGVIDVRCGNGKVIVCKNGNESCLNTASVNKQITTGGAKLGHCPFVYVLSQAQSADPKPVAPEKELKVIASPNPTNTFFTLTINSNDLKTNANVRVVDGTGRPLQNFNDVSIGSSITFGHTYAAGYYFAEVIQGSQRKVVKLIKMR